MKAGGPQGIGGHSTLSRNMAQSTEAYRHHNDLDAMASKSREEALWRLILNTIKALTFDVGEQFSIGIIEEK
jgi:hypothetical protein